MDKTNFENHSKIKLNNCYKCNDNNCTLIEGDYFYIYCNYCGNRSPYLLFDKTVDGAITAWNNQGGEK